MRYFIYFIVFCGLISVANASAVPEEYHCELIGRRGKNNIFYEDMGKAIEGYINTTCQLNKNINMFPNNTGGTCGRSQWVCCIIKESYKKSPDTKATTSTK